MLSFAKKLLKMSDWNIKVLQVFILLCLMVTTYCGNKSGYLPQTGIGLSAFDSWKDSEIYYGMGWYIHPQEEDAVWWHTGSIPGIATLLVRTEKGIAFAGLFNKRDRELTFLNELSDGILQVLEETKTWPDRDLFEKSL